MAAPNNPKGAKSDKEWREAIRRAVHEVREGENGAEKRLVLLARKLIDQALAGDVAAMREIGDRLDGKATQSVDMTVRDGFGDFLRGLAASDTALSEMEDEQPRVRH